MDEINEKIQEQKNLGFSAKEIKANLKSLGFNDQEIEIAIKESRKEAFKKGTISLKKNAIILSIWIVSIFGIALYYTIATEENSIPPIVIGILGIVLVLISGLIRKSNI